MQTIGQLGERNSRQDPCKCHHRNKSQAIDMYRLALHSKGRNHTDAAGWFCLDDTSPQGLCIHRQELSGKVRSFMFPHQKRQQLYIVVVSVGRDSESSKAATCAAPMACFELLTPTGSKGFCASIALL